MAYTDFGWRWVLCAAVTAAAGIPAGRAAEDETRVAVGGFYARTVPALDYARRNDPSGRTVTLVESGEGWRGKTFPLIEMEHRLTEHVGIEGHFSRVDADADALVRKTVRFLFFPLRLGARVAVRVESDSARLRLGWLASDPTWDGSGLWAGVQALRLSATYSLPGEGSQRESGTALLPSLGATIRYRLADGVTLMARGSHAPVQGGQLEGDMTEAEVAIEWAIGRQARVGLGYRDTRFRLDMRRADYTAEAALEARGPLAYVGWTF